MAVRIIVAALVLCAVSGPALAQSCGSTPIAPALPSVAEIAKKPPADSAAAKHDAFAEIKNWQADLKTYRACVTNVINQDKQQLATLDKDKKPELFAHLRDEASAADRGFNDSVNMEERVVNEFHAIQAAYCARTDVDKSSCPK
jgi:hypothetical protein